MSNHGLNRAIGMFENQIPPCEMEGPDVDGHCKHVLLPNPRRTVEIVEQLCRDDEAMSRIYLWSNEDMNHCSDTWKARRFDQLMGDINDSARIVAEEDIS